MFGAVRINSTVRYTYDVLWMARSRAWWVPTYLPVRTYQVHGKLSQYVILMHEFAKIQNNGNYTSLSI